MKCLIHTQISNVDQEEKNGLIINIVEKVYCCVSFLLQISIKITTNLAA